MPFNADGVSGIVYVWIGERSDPEDGKLAEEIANWMYDVCNKLAPSSPLRFAIK